MDELIHADFQPFGELVRRVEAELAIACERVVRRLDPGRPLLVFADHGFRLAADGRSYRHGGGSTLERLVPVLPFAPR